MITTAFATRLDALSAPSLVPDPPIDFDQLARISQGDPRIMRQLLQLFTMQAEVLTARMTSEAPKDAAARAHTLAVSAHSLGAWKVAESANAFEEAASRQPIVLGPAMRRLSVAITDAQAAITSFLTAAVS